jgi:hypothetical protein
MKHEASLKEINELKMQSLKEINELKMRCAQDETRKTYEVAIEAVTLQRDFYDKEISRTVRQSRDDSQGQSEPAV